MSWASRWARRKSNDLMYAVGMKKRIIETPWAKADNTHVRRRWAFSEKMAESWRRFQIQSSAARGAIQSHPLLKDMTASFDQAKSDVLKWDSDQASQIQTEEFRVGSEIRSVMNSLANSHLESPETVLDIVDRSVAGRRMCLSSRNRQFLTKLIKEHTPRAFLDVGCYYAAYSSCVAAVASESPIRITAIESSGYHGQSALSIATRLPSNITVHVGHSNYVLPSLEETYDMVLFDHTPMHYIRDITLLADKNKLRPNALVALVVDSVGMGNEMAEFLTYLKQDRRFKPIHGPPASPLYVVRYVGSKAG